MDALFIPNETDFKRWIKEALREYFHQEKPLFVTDPIIEENLIGRKEVAKLLKVSLVTLTDWVKRGLPSHRQRGRIYFDKKEVLNYIKEKKLRQCGIGSKLQHLKNEMT